MADRAAVLTRIPPNGGTKVRILHPPLVFVARATRPCPSGESRKCMGKLPMLRKSSLTISSSSRRHSSDRQSVRLSRGRSWERNPLAALFYDVDLAYAVERAPEEREILVRFQGSTWELVHCLIVHWFIDGTGALK